jgi:methionyl-tRNA formyltransferase
VTDTLTLVRAKAIAGEAGATATLVEWGGAIHIAAGNGGAIQVLEVQPAGKRPMPIADYCRGHAWRAGMVVRSI